MTRIEEIEQEILELARQDNEKYPENSSNQSHYNNPGLGNWARKVIDLWEGRRAEIILSISSSGGRQEIKKLEFEPDDPQSKFNLVKHITEQGRWFYEVTDVDTQTELGELVRKWERERERENIMCVICKKNTTYLHSGLCGACKSAKSLFENLRDRCSSHEIKANWERLLTEWQAAENGAVYLSSRWEEIQNWASQSDSMVLSDEVEVVKDRLAPRMVEILSREIQELKNQVQNYPELLRRVEEKETEINNLQERLTQSQEIGWVSEQTRVELAREKEELAEQIRNNQQTHQQELAQLQNSIEQLRTEIEQHLTKIQGLEEQLNAKTTEFNSELEKSRQLSQNLTNLQEQKQANENNLREEIKNKESELQKTLTESKESTAGLRREIEELKEELRKSKEISKKSLENEQEKLKAVETKLNEQIRVNQQKEQSIEQLENNLAESERVLGEIKEFLSQSQAKITQLEAQVLNHEQLKGKYEERIKELTQNQQELQELLIQSQQTNNETQQELVRSQESNQHLEQEKQEISEELEQVRETLVSKKEMLKKSRLEVVGLQVQLKKMPKPEPVKPSLNKSEPVNPWMLGVILVAGVGLYLLLKRRKE